MGSNFPINVSLILRFYPPKTLGQEGKLRIEQVPAWGGSPSLLQAPVSGSKIPNPKIFPWLASPYISAIGWFV